MDQISLLLSGEASPLSVERDHCRHGAAVWASQGMRDPQRASGVARRGEPHRRPPHSPGDIIISPTVLLSSVSCLLIVKNEHDLVMAVIQRVDVQRQRGGYHVERFKFIFS